MITVCLQFLLCRNEKQKHQKELYLALEVLQQNDFNGVDHYPFVFDYKLESAAARFFFLLQNIQLIKRIVYGIA